MQCCHVASRLQNSLYQLSGTLHGIASVSTLFYYNLCEWYNQLSGRLVFQPAALERSVASATAWISIFEPSSGVRTTPWNWRERNQLFWYRPGSARGGRDRRRREVYVGNLPSWSRYTRPISLALHITWMGRNKIAATLHFQWEKPLDPARV